MYFMLFLFAINESYHTNIMLIVKYMYSVGFFISFYPFSQGQQQVPKPNQTKKKKKKT